MLPDDAADGPESPENGGETSAEAGAPDTHGDVAASESLAAAISPAPALDAAAGAYLQRAQLAEDRLAEVLAAYRTLRTENEGYRERLQRNLERRFDQRRERLLLRFIEILDNLDRALEAAETTYAGEPLIEGLILVRTQLLQTLKDEGLERIPVVGLPYDPHTSEAVATKPVEDPDHHHLVVKDVQRGYRLNSKLVRPARVVVGEYAGEGEIPPASDDGLYQAPTAEVSLPAEGELPEDELPEPPELEGDPELDAIIARAEAQDGGQLAPAQADGDSGPERGGA